MKSVIKHITISAKIPEGVAIGDLSRSYPEVAFNITNGHWLSEDERILYITAKNWKKDYYRFLKKHSAVTSISQIGTITRIRIKSGFLKKFEQKEMTIVYPTTLINGVHKIELLINKQQLNAIKRALPNIKILRITDSYKIKPKLTQRQEEILWKAYSFGYFDYPRKITLTNLAKLLKISKATLSQTLRAVESKAIKLLLEK